LNIGDISLVILYGKLIRTELFVYTHRTLSYRIHVKYYLDCIISKLESSIHDKLQSQILSSPWLPNTINDIRTSLSDTNVDTDDLTACFDDIITVVVLAVVEQG